MSSLGKCLFNLPFFFLLGCFLDIELHELFIYLEINPLSIASFENIFSHSEGCLFVLVMISFAVQKLLSLFRSHLYIFNFYYFRRCIKKDLTVISVRVFCLYFALGVL